MALVALALPTGLVAVGRVGVALVTARLAPAGLVARPPVAEVVAPVEVAKTVETDSPPRVGLACPTSVTLEVGTRPPGLATVPAIGLARLAATGLALVGQTETLGRVATLEGRLGRPMVPVDMAVERVVAVVVTFPTVPPATPV